MSRAIRRIIIHCAASPNGRALSTVTRSATEEIDDWHRKRGFRRSDQARAAYNPRLTSIGYHWVIDTDGAIYSGRHPDEIGAHAVGHNTDSLGICMVGTDRFTGPQWAALQRIVEAQRSVYPTVQVLGHRELPDVKKSCPGFDVGAWEAGGRQPLSDHMMEVKP